MPDFDVVIVGAGVAGSVAGYVLAQAGLDVLMIERGNYAGSKNMTGGRLYSHSLEKIMPGFAQEAPVERKVTRERISLLTLDSAVSIDFHSAQNLGQAGKESYTVLRSRFDRWLADKAEAAGANVITGVCVDDLLMKDGKIAGIISGLEGGGGEERIEAHAVILADGVNSLLAQKAGLKKELTPRQVAVGVKEIIELPESVIEDRFNLNPQEGLSWLFAGSCTEGKVGGGFLYTNKDTISLGLVATVSEIAEASKSLPQLLEDFKGHPCIQSLIKGGNLLEYSAHLVPEGGWGMLPKIYADNVLVVGDAAGLVINLGYMVRGMDLAIESARLAAETIIKAKGKGDFSAQTLSDYKLKLEMSFVGQDMQRCRKFPAFLEQTPRIFKEYPELAASLLTEMFVVDGSAQKPFSRKLMKAISEAGPFTLAKDGWNGIRSM